MRREFDPVAHAGSWIIGETAHKFRGRVPPPVGANIGDEIHVRIILPHVHLHVHTVNASGRIRTSFHQPEMSIEPDRGDAKLPSPSSAARSNWYRPARCQTTARQLRTSAADSKVGVRSATPSFATHDPLQEIDMQVVGRGISSPRLDALPPVDEYGQPLSREDG